MKGFYFISIIFIKLLSATDSKSGTVFEFISKGLDDEIDSNIINSNVVDLSDPTVQLEDWFTISSSAFLDNSKFPIITLKDGKEQLNVNNEFRRLNMNFEKSKADGAPSDEAFFFRIRSNYIYYTQTKQDLNILDAIYVKDIYQNDKQSTISKDANACFEIVDFEKNNWIMCAVDKNISMKWYCSIMNKLKKVLPLNCNPPNKASVNINDNSKSSNFEIHKVKQPVIIIPTSSKKCNENWNYENNGSDWECECKEGFFQSPIDLPGKESVTLISPLRPLFQYEKVESIAQDSTIDGLLQAGGNVRLRNDNGAIRIYHPNMGKVVQLDGSVFIAEEISFHTPSEHTIDGQIFDMEMQIIHYGRSVGDISKQVVVSFLFKSTPGVYNKFFEELDFFSLPNENERFRDLTQNFYIPSVFYTTEDDNSYGLPPFSFYTYEGSLTKPPCTQRTTYYVVADPIPLSNTIIQLFRESIRVKNNTKTNLEIKGNNRLVQPLNQRKVYLFDHIKFGCAEINEKKKTIVPEGHYEKKEKIITEYIFVSNSNPSGIPNSFVVSEKEAKGQ